MQPDLNPYVSLYQRPYFVIGGIIVGFFIALMQMSRSIFLQIVANIYKEIFRCSPLIVLLIWIFYCMPALIKIEFSAITTGFIVLICYGGAVYGETFRAGFQAIPTEQKDAATSLSLSSFQRYRYVLIPQLIRIIIPAIVSWSISIFKESSLVSVLAVGDLMFQARSLSHEYYLPAEFLTIAATMYYFSAAPLEQLVNYLEGKARAKIAR